MKFLTGRSIFWISMTNCFRKFGRKIHPALEFLVNNNTMWCHFFPKLCTLILKFSDIISNFADGNVNFSTFETIWLILTPRHTFNEEIRTIFQQIITLLKNFSSELISYFRIFGPKVYPALEFSGKKYTQGNGTSPGTPNSKYPPWGAQDCTGFHPAQYSVI